MKTNKISLYFFLIATSVTVVLCICFYIFTLEKDLIQRSTIQTYRENAATLIVDKVYEDILLENFLEANRKFNILKRNKIINDYQIIKKNQNIQNKMSYCEKIFFDKESKKNLWGEICINFPQSYKESKLVNLRSLFMVFLFLILFIILIIFFIFKKITSINQELYVGIERTLNSDTSYDVDKSFWAPVLRELDTLVKSNKDSEKKIFNLKVESELIELATQVAHDIRSPLATLQNISFDQFPDKSNARLANSAITRLKGIANILLEKGNSKNSDKTMEINIDPLISKIIESKNLEFPGREIQQTLQAQNKYVIANEIKLESILSNLITNSIEASNEHSQITITSEEVGNNCIITIADKGKGIPLELLSKLGKEKLTFGKENGNGLGIFYAVQTINSWNGILTIESEINRGTIISISLPLVKMSSEVPLKVLLDNDELVRLTWEMRANKNGIALKLFKNTSELYFNLDQFPLDTTFYIDSELDNEKGEDVALYLYQKGYSNLTMCSGYSPDRFSHLSFIKKVIGKAPPF